MFVKNMELHDRIDGAYFTHEIQKFINIEVNIPEWLEEEEYASLSVS